MTHTLAQGVLFLFLILLFLPAVSAQTVSFADPDATTHRDVYIYRANGTLWGSYNTTSTGIAIPNDTDLIFTLKPQYSSPLDDPSTFLASMMSWLQTNAVTLIFAAAVGGLLFKRW